MQTWFTIVAIYQDNMQRIYQWIEASSATEAQRLFSRRMRRHHMLIAGVLLGRHKCVDQEDSAEWPSISNKPEAR